MSCKMFSTQLKQIIYIYWMTLLVSIYWILFIPLSFIDTSWQYIASISKHYSVYKT